MEISLDTVNLTAPEVLAILAALDVIPVQATFLVTLTPKERQSLLKAKNKRIGFIEQAHTLANTETDILPRNFDLDSFNHIYGLYTSFSPIEVHAEATLQPILDTGIVIRSILMTKSLVVYASAKIAGRSGGFESALEDMENSFAHKPKPPVVPPVTPPTPPVV